MFLRMTGGTTFLRMTGGDDVPQDDRGAMFLRMTKD